jgi:hypothetical protein
VQHQQANAGTPVVAHGTLHAVDSLWLVFKGEDYHTQLAILEGANRSSSAPLRAFVPLELRPSYNAERAQVVRTRPLLP